MPFEFFKPKAAKSLEQQKEEARTKALVAAGAVGAAALAGSAYEIHQENNGPTPKDPGPIEASMIAANPTIGMNSADAPKPITISGEASSRKVAEMPGAITSQEEHDVIEPIVHNVGITPTMEQKVVDVTPEQHVVHPEM